MQKSFLWYFLNIYGWLVIAMSVITAFIIKTWWIVLLGVIGYQLVIFFELTLGRNLGRTGQIRLARAEQENRELRAEQLHFLRAIEEKDQQIETLQNQLDNEKDDPPAESETGDANT